MASLPQTTPAWRVKRGDGGPVRCRIPMPKIPANNVLIKMKAHGVCHSDCAIRDGLVNSTVPPEWAGEFTLGHEGAGEIVQLGSGVSDADFKIGDLVAIHCGPGCKECSTCKRGYTRLCKEENNGGYGMGRDGLFQEYVSIRAEGAVKVPPGVTVEQAAVASDAILTAYHALKYAAEVKPDQTILIIGLGGLGLNAVQVALHLGVKRVLVCDNRQDAVDIAVRLGISQDDAFCTGAEGAKPVHELVAAKGIGVDTVIDFVGLKATVMSAQLAVRPAGLIVLVGLLGQEVALVPVIVVSNILTIKGSFAGTVQGLKECLDLLAAGVLHPQIETGSIEDLPRVMKDLDEGRYQGRKVLLPQWRDD